MAASRALRAGFVFALVFFAVGVASPEVARACDICAIYTSVARRAGMRAALLPFPGQVLLAVSDGDERLIVDAAAGGRLLTIRQCVAHLASLGLPYRERWLKPASDLDLLRRHGRNLAHAFASGGLIQRARARELRLVEEAFGFDREWSTRDERETNS